MDSSSSDSTCSSSDISPAEVFAGALMDQINKTDVVNMVGVQRDMLSRFEKTNEMLINFNILSANRYAIVSQDFRKDTTLMYDMKKDLDTIFKRIRVLKQRLGTMYPDAFKAADVMSGRSIEDVDDKKSKDYTKSTPSTSSTDTLGSTQSLDNSKQVDAISGDVQRSSNTPVNLQLPGTSSRNLSPSTALHSTSKSSSDLHSVNVSTKGSINK